MKSRDIKDWRERHSNCKILTMKGYFVLDFINFRQILGDTEKKQREKGTLVYGIYRNDFLHRLPTSYVTLPSNSYIMYTHTYSHPKKWLLGVTLKP